MTISFIDEEGNRHRIMRSFETLKEQTFYLPDLIIPESHNVTYKYYYMKQGSDAGIAKPNFEEAIELLIPKQIIPFIFVDFENFDPRHNEITEKLCQSLHTFPLLRMMPFTSESCAN